MALGQTYFAVQTRRQELAEEQERLEDQKRLLLRQEMKTRVESREKKRVKAEQKQTLPPPPAL